MDGPLLQPDGGVYKTALQKWQEREAKDAKITALYAEKIRKREEEEKSRSGQDNVQPEGPQSVPRGKDPQSQERPGEQERKDPEGQERKDRERRRRVDGKRALGAKLPEQEETSEWYPAARVHEPRRGPHASEGEGSEQGGRHAVSIEMMSQVPSRARGEGQQSIPKSTAASSRRQAGRTKEEWDEIMRQTNEKLAKGKKKDAEGT